jgi:hypothetical protein
MGHRKRWITLWLFQAALSAQWLHYPTPGIPRSRDGKPNLSAPAPKGRDGRPDLSGLWMPENTPNVHGTNGELLPALFIDITAGLPQGSVSMEPQAAALLQERLRNNQKDEPVAHCQPFGVPRMNVVPAPIKIYQMSGVTLVLDEADTSFRQIYTDGRALPDDPQPSWMGYSTGKWVKDTFVVDTVGFHDNGWLDAMGHPHSGAMRVTESFHRRDFGHMAVQITIDDRKNYKQPFTVTQELSLLPDSDLLEYFCTENERDTRHFSDH